MATFGPRAREKLKILVRNVPAICRQILAALVTATLRRGDRVQQQTIVTRVVTLVAENRDDWFRYDAMPPVRQSNMF